MAANTFIDFQTFRKRKSRSRLLEALERFFTDVLIPNNDESLLADAEEFEEFIAEVLGEHIIGKIRSSKDIRGMDQEYRQFDQRLRHTLQLKIKTLARFEGMNRF